MYLGLYVWLLTVPNTDSGKKSSLNNSDKIELTVQHVNSDVLGSSRNPLIKMVRM